MSFKRLRHPTLSCGLAVKMRRSAASGRMPAARDKVILSDSIIEPTANPTFGEAAMIAVRGYIPADAHAAKTGNDDVAWQLKLVTQLL